LERSHVRGYAERLRSNYGEHASQHGELTRGGDAGVAVLIHGGFWRQKYGCDQMRPLAADLAARGWTTWNLEYRRLGDGGGYPATLDDVAAGIDHLAGLDLDLRRVVAIGHSAGGHLAAWAATREAPGVALTDMVSQAGVLDLRLAWSLRLSDGVVEQFLGGLDDERVAAASPRERLPLRARALLTHGEHDTNVPIRISREFAAASGAELHVDPDAAHMEHIDPSSRLWEAVTAWL
jgi:acetyl esterase/lipase